MNVGASGFPSIALTLLALTIVSVLVRAAASRFYVSRPVTYLAALVTLCALYLLAEVSLAIAIAHLGAAGPALAVAFVLGMTLVLVSLASSAAFRRKLRVLINKHFYRSKHDYRVEWLRFARKMSTVATQDVHAVSIQAVAEVFGSDRGVLFVLDENARGLEAVASWVGSAGGGALHRPPEIDISSPLVTELLAKGWIIDCEEYRRTPGLYGDVTLPAWLVADGAFRLVSPIRRADKLVAVLALGAPPQPFELTYEDRDLLATLGQHIDTHLAQFDADRKIAESKQFETFNQLTAFMMHDLKNAVAQLRLVVSNATRHKRNPEFVDDAVVTIGNAVTRIDRLIGQLRFGVREAATQDVRIDQMLNGAIARCAARRPVPTIDGSVPDVVVEADPERLVSVIEHALRNAQDATSESGHVRVTCDLFADRVAVIISDDGTGMDAEFIRERLFTPFDTTKGASGMGIGAYQVREYARSLGGNVQVQSTPGSGTRFVIILPTVDQETTHG
jgi:putative PEP-CTERM system histidine kinase